MKLKKIILMLIPLMFLTGCNLKKDNLESATIYTTIYPIKYLTKFLYKDYATIESIYPSGADVVSYELTSKQLKKYAKDNEINTTASKKTELIAEIIEHK